VSTSTRRSTAAETRPLDDQQLALLEEEREFLLRSLDDLDAEYAAGDVDEVDYRALRDDYTRRAANVLRAIEQRRAKVAAPRKRSRSGAIVWIAGILLVGGIAGLLLGRATGGRGGGEMSGDIRLSTRSLINEAQLAFGEGDTEKAIELYDEALGIAPGNVEALTYRGWTIFRSGGDAEEALADLDEAVAVDPSFADARVFRASILLDQGDAGAAGEELAVYDTIENRPPMADQLLVSFRLRERVALAAVEPVLFGDEPPDDPGAAVEAAGLDADDLRLAAEHVLEQGDLTRAIVIVDAGLARDPDDPSMLALLGWIDALASQAGATPEQQEILVPRALAQLARAVELAPDLPHPRVYRAILLTELGRTAEAEADLAVFCAASQDPKLQEYLVASGLSC
jgi:tetratricopeptide (TPR) repeat protein